MNNDEYMKHHFDEIKLALKENTAELSSLRTEVERGKTAVFSFAEACAWGTDFHSEHAAKISSR